MIDCERLDHRCNARHRQTFFNLVNVYLQHWKHLYSWERITQKIYHQKYREQSHFERCLTYLKLIVGQSDEIFGVSQINWEDSPWKQLSLVSDEEVISLSHAKVYVFSDSVLCLGKVNQNPTSNTVWEEKLSWFKDSPQYRTLDTIDGEPMEFEWNISQDSPHCSSSTKSKSS